MTTPLENTLIVNALSRIDGKIDKLDERMDGMSNVLVKQQGILDEHIRRTELLEAKIESDTSEKKEQNHKMLMFFLKLSGGLIVAGGSGVGIRHLVPLIFKALGIE
jgi:hypothetical protein